jgi:NIMA (never in mitosis gene a)-related kinase
MEYCEGGDISTLIRTSKKEKQQIPEDMIWSILSQVLLALKECHTRPEGKIMHRDLKPGNIFLDADYNVKLGDFGLSRVMGDESIFAYTHVGTPYYMSPEQINEQRYNEKSDIWSLGCVIYEIAALRAPFEATTHLQLAVKIKDGKVERIPKTYSDELHQFILCMLE